MTWRGLFQTLASFASLPKRFPAAGTECGMARAAEPGPAASGKAGELSQPAPIFPWIFPRPGLGQRVCPEVTFLTHKFISIFEALCLVGNNEHLQSRRDTGAWLSRAVGAGLSLESS